MGAPVPLPTMTLEPAAKTGATSAQQASMREELFLAGAPAFARMDRCVMPESLPPGSLSATWTSTLETGLLCLFGFGDNESVHYQVWDAAGDLVLSSDGTPDNMDGDALPSVKVFVDIGGSAPGLWTVEAGGASGDLSSGFAAQPVTLDGEPAVVLSFRDAPQFQSMGDEMSVLGYGLAPNGSATIGIYEVTSEDSSGSNLRLHESSTLPVDGTGATAATLTLDPSYRSGVYCVVLAASAAYVPSRELDLLGATRCFEVTQ